MGFPRIGIYYKYLFILTINSESSEQSISTECLKVSNDDLQFLAIFSAADLIILNLEFLTLVKNFKASPPSS